MKRTIKNLAVILMMVIAFCLVAIQASAADASALTFANCEGGVMVSDCNEAATGELTIPAEYNGSKVVKIGANAFDNCIGLNVVTIPEGVTAIGDSAFEGCSAMEVINLPESLTAIGDYAFFGCDGLKTVVLYPAVTDIGAYAFYDCANLHSIALPESLTAIKEGTFGECVSLATIFVPSKVQTIETAAFSGCDIKYVYYTASMYTWNGIAWGEDNEALFKNADAVKFNHVHEHVSNIINQPTCTEKGKAVYICECGNTYTGAVDAVGHKAEKIEEVKATCTEAGKTAGEKCMFCGIILTEPAIVPATGHKTVVDAKVEATCTSTGLTKGSHCDFCGEVFEKQEVIEMIGHDFDYESLKVATTKENGKRKGTCKLCGYVADETLYNVTVFKLSTSKCTYNGKKRTPSVTVKDSEGNKLIEGRDFTVKYPDGRKNPGIYKIKVTLQGEYKGSKTLKFTIAPGKTSDIKATPTKSTAVKLTWKEVPGATGYRVYIYKTVDGKTRVKAASVKTNSYVLSKNYSGKSLKMGTTYKIAIAAYTKTSDDTVIHAENGVAYTFKFIPVAPTLKVSSPSKGKVKISWSDVSGETGYQIYYSKDGKKFTKLESYKGWPDAQTISGLKSGKTYFKVRAYTKVGSETVHGTFSAVKSVNIK